MESNRAAVVAPDQSADGAPEAAVASPPSAEEKAAPDPASLPRANPYTLRRTQDVVETRYFTDPLQEGVAFPLRLRAARGTAAALNLRDVSDRLADAYIKGPPVTGKFLPGGEPVREEPEPVINFKGENAPVTETLCRLLASILTQQEPSVDGGYRAWTDKELILIAEDAPTAFGEMSAFANEMRYAGESNPKNGSSGRTGD